jgi:hypothetical protein
MINQLNITMPKFGNIKISLGNEEYNFNMLTKKGQNDLNNFMQSISDLNNWISIWQPYFTKYKFIEKDIMSVINKSDYNEYEYVENLSLILSTASDKPSNEECVALLKDKYPDNKLIFDSSNLYYVSIRSKDKKYIKKFVSWFYTIYIKPKLKEIKSIKIK